MPQGERSSRLVLSIAAGPNLGPQLLLRTQLLAQRWLIAFYLPR